MSFNVFYYITLNYLNNFNIYNSLTLNYLNKIINPYKTTHGPALSSKIRFVATNIKFFPIFLLLFFFSSSSGGNQNPLLKK